MTLIWHWLMCTKASETFDVLVVNHQLLNDLIVDNRQVTHVNKIVNEERNLSCTTSWLVIQAISVCIHSV
jgi:lactam utilization protein B